MIRSGAIGALALALVALAALAQPIQPQRVAVSNGTFHIALCAGPAPRGYARCFARLVSDRTGRPLVNQFGANRLERTARSSLVPLGYGPNALISAYNPAVAATYPVGVGAPATTIAIIGAFGYPLAEHDMGVYRSTYHLPPCTTANGCFKKFNQRGVHGSYPAFRQDWSGEAAIDLDMASAMCPGCKIILVEADDNGVVNLGAAVDVAVSKGAHVTSSSYGGGEGVSAPRPDDASYNHPGVAVVAASGDGGYVAGPQHPAALPNVVSVGGTRLLLANNARGWTEAAWDGAGSGCSKLYPKPAWQKDTLCTRRMIADISAVADPNTPIAFYGPPMGLTSDTSSAWMQSGGTSVSAPVIAGLFGANGGPVTPGSVYAASVKVHDVKQGINGSCGGTYFCAAATGYDGPTGRGTPTGEAGY